MCRFWSLIQHCTLMIPVRARRSRLPLASGKDVEVLLQSRDARLSAGNQPRSDPKGYRMWFAILGPLLVSDGESQVDLPKGRQRVLLADLLLHAGRPVPASALAEVVWDGTPPPGGAVTLRSHVLRLRRVLGPRAGDRLVTRHPGYLIRAEEDEVDVLQFRRLCRDGGTALRDDAWAQASRLLSEALSLWRAAPLVDVSSELLLRDEVPGLEALRLQAEEWRIDADLQLGRHDELIPALQVLAAEHPLRERVHAQLMLALYRSSRQAEALAAYQHARHMLIDEVGAEPGRELRELHQRILAADPTLALSHSPPAAVGSARVAPPRQLPAGVPQFTGRAGELELLTQVLDQASDERQARTRITAISGTAGVGKTALAIQWAHQVTGCFPDGQLYVNLRGYDPAQPMPATYALARFLRAMGVPGQDIPSDEDERAARYRSLLAGKRMLIVLDNAGSADQVRPLLSGTPTCTVIVTSRDALAGLVARDGATRLDLDLLPPEDAVDLLRTLIGARVDAAPDAAAELADQCCRLPLALRVAAELAASHRGAPLAELTGELADLRKRLDLLVAGGDHRTAVRAVFSWSYQHLGADAARAFRLLSLHPGPRFESYAAAALTGMTTEQADQMLDVLARAHLIHATDRGRHEMHDLLRAYALERATAEDAEAERRRALTRLFDYYLATAAMAMDALVPAESHRRPRVRPPGTPFPAVTGAASARAWLDAERATLVDVTAHTAAHGWPGHATRLAATTFRYLESGGYYSELSAIQGLARRAARDTGDLTAEALALQSLSVVDLRQGRYRQAAEKLRQALAVYRQTGDRAGEARALGNLGIACFVQGRYELAIGHYEQALNAYLETGEQAGASRALNNLGLLELRLGCYQQASDRFQQVITLWSETGNQPAAANALSNLGVVHLRLGHYQQASDQLSQALALCRETGNRAAEAYAMGNLGLVYLRLGRHQEASDQLSQALALCRETGNRAAEAYAMGNLGLVYLRLGRHQEASDQLSQALALCRETGDLSSEAEALNGMGEVCLATGLTSDARQKHAAALGLASKLGDKYERARAHDGLARAHQAAGTPGQARRHWRQALSLYADLGAPEADDIRAQLIAAAENSATGAP
jgi:DNA-binding SARP family transcriptional activator/tetratricopeptide (TPR) repeat protein